MGAVSSPFLALGGFVLGTGAGAVMGQGDDPELWALMSFSNAQTDPPVWTTVTADVREFSVSRGRESETQDFDAGTATVTLDNRDRAFDPTYASSPYYPNVRPRNRIWLREQFSGVTQDIFKGYVEAYDQQWPAPGQSDAVTVVQAADELKILNTKRTEAFDPPSAPDYVGVVGSDNPSHYFRWRDPFLTATTIVTTENEAFPVFDPNFGPYGGVHGMYEQTATVEGPGWRSTGSGYGQSSDTPLLGNQTGSIDGVFVAGCLLLDFVGTANQLTSTDQTAGDMAQSTKGTAELWFKKTANPGANGFVWYSPEVNGVAARMWYFQLNTTGTVSWVTRQVGAGTTTSTSGVLNNDTWYHIVGVRTGASQLLYVNGVQVAGALSAAAWEQSSATVLMGVTNPGTGVEVALAEQAVYPGVGLTAARVLAHYQAGTSRGFARTEPGLRIGDTLDMVQNHAPRSIQTGVNDITAMFSANRPALDHIRAAAMCEKPDGMFFCTAGGTLVFLAAAHRASSPYNTTQVTFGDEGTIGTVPYLDFDSDYSDSWIANQWSVTKGMDGAVTQTVSDATSISVYDEIAQTVDGIPLVANADALTIANAYLAKYKDPMLRGQSLVMSTGDTAVTEAFFTLELGERIRVVRTIPHGLGWFDQVMYVQKIEVSGSNSLEPWSLRLAVSPL